MIEEAFGHRISQETLKEVLPDYQSLNQQLLDFNGTNIRNANFILNIILNDQEKLCLEKAFFGDTGWYHKINYNGMLDLKLAAMSLGITNEVFTFDKDKENRILNFVEKKSIDDQLLMIQCYIKQKVVTYKTLRNYLQNVQKTDKMAITLYRGINIPYENQKYLFTGLESWTTDINIAYKFARNEGFVLQRDYPISQIFAGKRSTFKNLPNRSCQYSGFYVRREKEMIVENFENEWDLNIEKDIKLAIEKEIC